MARKATTNQELSNRRAKQLDEIRTIGAALRTQKQELSKRNATRKLLSSVAVGLYEELDKLCKKAPAESVTNLSLKHINEAIREIKELGVNDSFLQRLSEFVPAGDNPELRDAVFVMRQALQGLERLESAAGREEQWLGSRLADAHVIETALRLFQEGDSEIALATLQKHVVGDAARAWTAGGDFDYQRSFDFERLDALNYGTHFAQE